jgi:aryl-phospho-beta-D-glucosidase BglC (GH1 family)
MAKDAGLVVLFDLHGVPGSQNGLDNSGLRSNDTNPAR